MTIDRKDPNFDPARDLSWNEAEEKAREKETKEKRQQEQKRIWDAMKSVL